MEPKVVCVLLLVCTLAARSLAQGLDETCEMEPQARVNCGHPGITHEECRHKSCCFDNTVPGYPWCFQPRVELPEEDCTF